MCTHHRSSHELILSMFYTTSCMNGIMKSEFNCMHWYQTYLGSSSTSSIARSRWIEQSTPSIQPRFCWFHFNETDVVNVYNDVGLRCCISAQTTLLTLLLYKFMYQLDVLFVCLNSIIRSPLFIKPSLLICLNPTWFCVLNRSLAKHRLSPCYIGTNVTIYLIYIKFKLNSICEHNVKIN